MNDKENVDTSKFLVYDINNNTINHIVGKTNIVMIQICFKDFDYLVIVQFCLSSTGHQFCMVNNVAGGS